MAHLSLSLLGPFQATLDGQSVTDFDSAKVRALLAYLAVEADRPHSREALAGLLWPDYPDRSALNSLRSALANLRQAIGDRQAEPPFLLITRGTIQFNTASDYDLDLEGLRDLTGLDAIDRLAQTVSVCRGSFLEGFLCDSATFEEWVLFKREQVNRQMFKALRSLAACHEQRGEYEQAQPYARQRLELEPWDEEAHQQLMRALALGGQRSAALAQYETCRRLLMQELGVDPSPETTALCESIRDGKLEKEIRPRGQVDKERVPALTNVPVPLTSFVGRQREMTDIKRLLVPLPCKAREGPGAGVRLLTLTGAGGCGKTRLAIQVARDLAAADCFKHGVWWVDLAALSDPAFVPQAAAIAFDLRESPAAPLATILTNYLCAKELLLVLDNCEHLIDACARLAEVLLSACPGLQILATSREALGLMGEVSWCVPPLASPDAERLPPLECLLQYDAILLFVERAAAVSPQWSLAKNASAVARICSRLDGIPLAIELAAARLKVLSAEQIAARLDDRFRLLTDSSRTALPRHRTLRAAVDWSYGLLLEEERVLFRQLSVFAGGWTLEAAEAICAGESGSDEVEANSLRLCPPVFLLDILTALVSKSLVVVEQQGEAMRYRMLETIRQYAREKLAESGEAEVVRAHHLGFFSQFAERAEPELRRAEQKLWLDRLEAEHDNLRAALGWALDGEDAATAAQLGGNLWHFWAMHGHLGEGRRWLERILALETQGRTLLLPSARVKLLNGEGSLAFYQGDHASAHLLFEEGLALARDVGDKWGMAFALDGLGAQAANQGDYERATTFSEQSLALSREIGAKWLNAITQINLGELARLQGDYQQATRFYEGSLALLREVGDKWFIAIVLHDLGQVAQDQGQYDQAKAIHKESLALCQELGGQRSIAMCLEKLAGVAGAQRQPERAARLLGVAEAIRQAITAPMGALDRPDYERSVTMAYAGLDKEKFAAAWAEGHTMTLERAIEYALENLESISG